jgi:hypothetical protein
MNGRKRILGDHRKKGNALIPPFVDQLGNIREISWRDTILPELVWLALIHERYGDKKSVELVTFFTRSVRSILGTSEKKSLFLTSEFYEITPSQQKDIMDKIANAPETEKIREALKPLYSLYPECPLSFIFRINEGADLSMESGLDTMRVIVTKLFNRTERFTTMVQATAIWTMFDAGALVVNEGLALARFPEIENYPKTEISTRVASGIRATLNMSASSFFVRAKTPNWSSYFWNRGLELSACEVHYD